MPSASTDRLLQLASAQKVLVVGDVILDAYLQGDAVRISPEAPVPVVDIYGQRGKTRRRRKRSAKST